MNVVNSLNSIENFSNLSAKLIDVKIKENIGKDIKEIKKCFNLVKNE